MIYVDSSALLKLIVVEPESDALEGFLSERGNEPVISSGLARVEVPRAIGRRDPALVPRAVELIEQLDLVPVDAVLTVAAGVGDPTLRTLDAIHLAAAMSLGAEVAWFVAYDRRLLAGAREQRLPVAHPGMTRSR